MVVIVVGVLEDGFIALVRPASGFVDDAIYRRCAGAIHRDEFSVSR